MPSIQKIVLALAFAATALSAQISDGQLQQATTPVAVVKQITDGQIQQVASASKAPVPSSNGTAVTTPASPAATFHGAASIVSFSSELAAVAIGAVAVFAML